MSITREQAATWFETMHPPGPAAREMYRMAAKALRPVSREQVRKHIEWPLYVWVEGPIGGEIYCTGNYPRETCWRRCGVTGGYA